MKKAYTPNINSSKGKDLTKYVSKFIYDTKFKNIPNNVVELAKKHILDGFGLALSGSVARTGDYLFKQIKKNSAKGKATVIGSKMKVPSQFAALANGVGIHSDDYDDTQLAVGSDRVYGLLTHPTAPCLPSAFAEGEINKISGKDFLNAYLIGVDVETSPSLLQLSGLNVVDPVVSPHASAQDLDAASASTSSRWTEVSTASPRAPASGVSVSTGRRVSLSVYA